jgi:hypothetical protein
MSANTTSNQAKTDRRAEMIALARDIRGEFAKIHAQMGKVLARVPRKKVA